MKIYLAAKRGFCAGVRRAVGCALAQADKKERKVFILHALVHNDAVIRRLAEKGIAIVDSPQAAGPDSVLILSAHGVSTAVEKEAHAAAFHVIDATCPLVRKVHQIAESDSLSGKTVLLAGKRGHREVEGILGRIPGEKILLSRISDAKDFIPVPEKQYSFLSQTTFLEEEFEEMRKILEKKIPGLSVRNTVCASTSERQEAVREMARSCTAIVVAGSERSSNSVRLCEVARAAGAKAFLLDGSTPLPEELIHSPGPVGLTSGASAAEEDVRKILNDLLALPGAEFAGEL